MMINESKYDIINQKGANMKRTIEHLKASLFAGAMGDALGWPIEFRTLDKIKSEYGPLGCTKLIKNAYGIVEVSDDTQMTLFTLEGIVNFLYLKQYTSLNESIYQSYLRWYKTQTEKYKSAPSSSFDLMSYQELFFQRAPGITCKSALASGIMGTFKKPINNSKGCGAVMRAAPIGYFFDADQAFDHGCASGAITHGHPLGYLSAGALAYLMSKIFDGEELKSCVSQTIKKLALIPTAEIQVKLLKLAMELSESDQSDIQCILNLGEGWVGEEALAIAVYCSLKYPNDLQKALVASVNHDGDSDSTGSITGNILGATLGMNAIKKDWLQFLEVTELVTNFCDFIEHHDKS
jgi:ADP-ribosylglycohydrolase